MAKQGRPTKYTEALGDEICATVATSEEGLALLCKKNPHWPDRATIFTWRRVHEKFRDQYAKAKEDQCEVVVEYMQEVMAEPHKYIDDMGREKVDVPMLRLKMDTMKWHAAKLKPKKFGDARTVEDLTVENAHIKAELEQLRAKLYAQNKKEY